MNIIAIIPARLASSRLPNKPLIDIEGKALIMHVHDNVQQIKEVSRVIIATDDQTILKVAQAYGAEAILTDINHISGTDRIAEVVEKLNLEGIIINIQGDEPLVNEQLISPIVRSFQQPQVQIVSVCSALVDEADIVNPNIVKVTKSKSQKALYFSRSVIPYNRDGSSIQYFKHIGIYAFRSDVLRLLVRLPSSSLEEAEKLEQLRWLENDYDVHMVLTQQKTIGIDTPEDLDKYRSYLSDQR